MLELPFDKRRLFNVLHSVAAGEEVHEGVVRLQDYARRSAAAKVRVLVADDNPTNREVIGKILERSGHTITLVNDGEQTLDALEREAYDIVILDRNMPGMSGIEALQAIRLMTRARAAAGHHAFGRRNAGGEARGARGGRRHLPAEADRALRLLDEIQRLAPKPDAGRKDAPAVAAPREAPASAPAVVNAETLSHLEELGSSLAFVERLITVFVSDSSGILERIEKVLAGRDFHEFRSLVHAMKGSSASMGTDRLTRACASLGKLSDAELRLQAPALLHAERGGRCGPLRARELRRTKAQVGQLDAGQSTGAFPGYHDAREAR